MKTLQKKIIINFIISLVVLYIITAITDGIFEIFLRKYSDYSLPFNIIGALNILLSILYIVIVTYYFVKVLKRDIQATIKEQVEAINLIYASIAHDLKTPMTSIKGNALALKDNKVPAESVHQKYEMINMKVNEMEYLLNNILSYAKLSGGMKQSKVHTDVTEMLRSIVIEHLDAIENKNLQYAVDIPNQQIEILAAPMELKRALSNIVINAIQHNAQGTKIAIGLIEENEQIKIYVADDGSFIDEDIKADIFKPFMKQNSHRPSGTGSGLGLSIVKEIISSMDGTVNLEQPFKDYQKAFVVTLHK
ncbi:sensor histidine kinase [Macrococcus capreoli]|uniref:sensor histidine kinase n=1 Tax=Macrococcus capreoli TaxID=2982690 RepID=UPI0021D5AC0B|nr:HAMP domain-containing sensor histidine kinase [Macrococcus sp. TMW 2.2395]MCU7557651.1 HAMP domain-containing histidine kinase [Macrococcus sp. TMW 2.2395]